MPRPVIIATMSSADLLRIAAKFGLTADELNKAAAAAVNDVALTGRGLTRKRVRAYVTLPAARVNSAIEIKERAKPERLTATIVLDRRGGKDLRPTLMSFKGKPTEPYRASTTKTGRKRKKKPFGYQILKNGPRVTLQGGFVQFGQEFAAGNIRGSRRATGRPQAFVRKTRARYPLRVPRGPSVAAIWQNKANGVATDVLKDLNGRLPARVQGQAQRIFDRKWKKVKG